MIAHPSVLSSLAPTGRLRAVIVTKKSNFLSFLTRKDVYNEDKLRADVPPWVRSRLPFRPVRSWLAADAPMQTSCRETTATSASRSGGIRYSILGSMSFFISTT